jgi:hypothetical protein
MKQLFTVLCIFLFYTEGFSQETKTDSLLTETKNIEWIAKFEKLSSKAEQITTIKQKIFADSIFIVHNTTYDRIGNQIVVRNGNSLKKYPEKIPCDCKILFKLSVRGDFYNLDPIRYLNTVKAVALLSEDFIEKITVLKNYTASAIYGSNGRCGVVILSSNSRKLKRKIRRVI